MTILDFILGYAVACVIVAGVLLSAAGLTAVWWDWHSRHTEGRR